VRTEFQDFTLNGVSLTSEVRTAIDVCRLSLIANTVFARV
jgi:hypothetical protein